MNGSLIYYEYASWCPLSYVTDTVYSLHVYYIGQEKWNFH